MSRLKVACVLRSSPDYNREYVERLWRGVSEHLKEPHTFVCLSDVDVPCARIPLTDGWGGWWSKIEMFKLEPPVLYFDLDTIPVGDLGDMAAAAQRLPFITLRDFYRPNGIGSGMMAWSIGMQGVYDAFKAQPQYWQKKVGSRGDQGYLEEVVQPPSKWQDVVPGQVVSYPADVKGKGVPEGARVVCFHGRPKPRDLNWTL